MKWVLVAALLLASSRLVSAAAPLTKANAYDGVARSYANCAALYLYMEGLQRRQDRPKAADYTRLMYNGAIFTARFVLMAAWSSANPGKVTEPELWDPVLQPMVDSNRLRFEAIVEKKDMALLKKEIDTCAELAKGTESIMADMRRSQVGD